MDESPNNPLLPPESSPPQKESWLSSVGVVILVIVFIAITSYLNGAPINNPNPYPNDPYSNPYNSPYSNPYGNNPYGTPRWYQQPQNPPPDIDSKHKIQEIGELEPETATWLDNQRAKTPGEIYRMNVGAVVAIATPHSSTSYSKNDSATHFMGSGIIVSSAKYGFCVLTVLHLLKSPYYKEGAPLMVYFRGMAKPQPARIAKRSKNYDAMLLQFTDSEFKPLQAAVIGKSAFLNAGADLFSIGSGYAGVLLLTRGVVSVKPHKFYYPDNSAFPNYGKEDEEFKWQTAILTDLTLAHGFSGGPLFNKLGQLVGIIVGFIPDAAGNITIGLPIDDLRKDFDNIF